MFSEGKVFHPLQCLLDSRRYDFWHNLSSVTSCICFRNAVVAVDGASNGALMTGLVMRLTVVEERAKCDNQANVEQHEVVFCLLHC